MPINPKSSKSIYYLEAEERWKLIELFSDLATIKRKFRPRSKSLSDTEKDYLCLLLCGHSYKNIAKMKQCNEGTVTKALSDPEGGLYRYIEKLTGKIIEDWRDVIIYILFTDKYYKMPVQTVTIDFPENLSEEHLSKVFGALKQILGNKNEG